MTITILLGALTIGVDRPLCLQQDVVLDVFYASSVLEMLHLGCSIRYDAVEVSNKKCCMRESASAILFSMAADTTKHVRKTTMVAEGRLHYGEGAMYKRKKREDTGAKSVRMHDNQHLFQKSDL